MAYKSGGPRARALTRVLHSPALAAPLAAPSAQTPSRRMKATLALALLLAAAACGSPQYRQPQPQAQPQPQGAGEGAGGAAGGKEGSVFTNEAIRQAQNTYLIPKDATIQKVQEGIELAAYEHIPGDQRINLFEILGAHVPPEVVNNLQAQVDQIGKQ